MYQLIIQGGPCSPIFHLSLVDQGQVIDQVGVVYDDLPVIVEEYLTKFEISEVNLAGPSMYMYRIEQEIRNRHLARYACGNIIFKYL